MIDILFLISDGPSDKGPYSTDRYYSLLKKIVSRKMSSYTVVYKFVVPNKQFNDIKKVDIEANRQEILDFIEEQHPRVIMAMGKHAFVCLGLPNTKITEIAHIPVESPYFGGPFIDERTPKYKVAVEVPDRGLYLSNKKRFELVTHSDIVVYPTYKYGSMLTYGTGYRGQALFERQLDRIKEILDHKEVFRPYKYDHYRKVVTLYKDKDDIKPALEAIYRATQMKYLSFDIETAGYNVPREAQLNFRHAQAEITVIAFGNDKEVHVINTHNLPELIPKIRQLLEKPGSIHLTWNGRFDIEFCKYLWNVKFDHTHIDGMSCLYLKDMSVSHMGKGSSTLKSSSATFLEKGAWYAGYQKNAGIDKAIKEGDGHFLAEHEEEFMLYAGIDVFLTYKTNQTLWRSLPKKSRKLVIDYYPSLEETLNDIHSGGIKINEKKMDEYIKDLKEFIEKVEESIQKRLKEEEEKPSGCKFSQGKFNPKSKPHIAEVLYEIIGLPKHYTEKGTLSVSSDIIKQYDSEPFVKLILDYNAFLKQLEIFETVKSHVRGGRCYPLYRQYRTTSGRLSSVNPPIQIIPKYKRVNTKGGLARIAQYRPVWKDHEIEYDDSGEPTLTEVSPPFKTIFVADEGFTLLYADYSQLEIIIFANYINQCSMDQTLQKAIIEGRDIHSYTASLLYTALTGTKYTEEFIKKHKEEEPYSSWRQDAKSVIFKLIYGGTYKSMAHEKGIPDEEAMKIFNTFLDVIPGIKDYMMIQKALARQHKKTETYPGHGRDLKIYGYEYNNNKAGNIALNHPIQGTASYIVNLAMIEYNKRLKELDERASILLTVHDSIASQVPTEKLEVGAKLKKECMEQYPMKVYKDFLKVPIKIDLEVGPNWNDLRSKD